MFKQNDWSLFHSVAVYYFDKAAKLKTGDITSSKNKLLLRNIQKRLFLGIGGELLVKAYFLKNGFYINRPLDKGKYPSRIIQMKIIDSNSLDKTETFSFNDLLDNLNKIKNLENWTIIRTP